MSQHPPYTEVLKTDAEHRKELYAVCVALSILGLSFASWASRVPDIRDAALLTAATLGYALTARGMGTLTMMPIIAGSINRVGAKKSTLVTGIVVALSIVPLAFVKNWIALGALLFVIGASLSGFNIAVNALGSKLEKESGRSHMSKIHSWFGIGNVVGAILGTLATRFEVSVLHHFTAIGLLVFLILFTVYRHLPEDTPHPDAERPKFKWPHGGLIAIGIIVFLASTIESTIHNWVTLFFTDYVQIKEGYGPVGYTVFAGALLTMRLIGDRLKTRFGARNLLVTGSVVATFGLLMAVWQPNPLIATAGFLLAGAGVAFNFPMVFSAAGREGAIALTSVATFGYVAGMVSQPVMGAIVERFGLEGGFIFVAIATVSVSVLAWRARLLQKVTT